MLSELSVAQRISHWGNLLRDSLAIRDQITGDLTKGYAAVPSEIRPLLSKLRTAKHWGRPSRNNVAMILASSAVGHGAGIENGIVVETRAPRLVTKQDAQAGKPASWFTATRPRV